MSRRMSCAMTIDAVRDRTKTVTRRHVDTWKTLKPGDTLTLIEKGMGLKRGEKQVVLAEVQVARIDVEPLVVGLWDRGGHGVTLTHRELGAEGFDPYSDPAEWAVWWARSHGYFPTREPVWESFGKESKILLTPLGFPVTCRRIEWAYVG